MKQPRKEPSYKLVDGCLALSVWKQPKLSNAYRIDISKSVQDAEGEWDSTSDPSHFTSQELETSDRLRTHAFDWLLRNAVRPSNAN